MVSPSYGVKHDNNLTWGMKLCCDAVIAKAKEILFVRVCFSDVCSSLLLRATAEAHHLCLKSVTIVRDVGSSLCPDDTNTGGSYYLAYT